jgi:hypothetical protein
VRGVDRRLAADGRIHLGEQGRGHIDVGDTAHERRGDETGDVQDDAAANRDDAGLPIDPGLEHAVLDVCFRRSCFAVLAGSKATHENAPVCAGDRLGDVIGKESLGGVVGDDHRVFPARLPQVAQLCADSVRTLTVEDRVSGCPRWSYF